MDNFYVQGPLGEIECIVEPNRSSKQAVLIMVHGFRGSRDSSGKAPRTAYQAAAWCDVVRFNFTGTDPVSTWVSELQAVINKVEELAPEAEIYLLGRSLGGATSIITAGKDSRIKRLILWSAINDLHYTFHFVMGEENYAKIIQGETLTFTDEKGDFQISPSYLHDFDQYDLNVSLKNLEGRCPVLLFHCEGDQVVVVSQAYNNIKALGHNVEAHIYPNGDHSIGDYSEEVGEIIAQWLGRTEK